MSDYFNNPSAQTSIPLNARLDLLNEAERIELLQMINFVVQNRRLHEALHQLMHNGPCWDGDVVSKADRDVLLKVGACSKVCVKGEQGFNACTYLGSYLLHLYVWIYGPLGGDSK